LNPPLTILRCTVDSDFQTEASAVESANVKERECPLSPKDDPVATKTTAPVHGEFEITKFGLDMGIRL
jgi:hypothetical protein